MSSAVVLINRGGGAVERDSEIDRKVAAALESAGVAAEVELIDGREYEERCRALVERGDPLLIVGGGDGTISAAASALVGSNTALGILPLGTLNHFARDLGVPADLEDAAKLIATGTQRQVDVAEMNGQVFINNSAIGLYPLMVIDRDLQRRRLGRSKKLAMLVASVRTLARFNHQRLTLTVNDEKERVDTPLLFVGNNEYRTDIGSPGTARKPGGRQDQRVRNAQEDSPRVHRGEPSRLVQSNPAGRHGGAHPCRATARRQSARAYIGVPRRRDRKRATPARLCDP